jgi:hypothetical protein
VFAHLCETFHGILPSISLFRYFFCLKPHPRSDSTSPLGGCGIQFCQGKKGLFFDYDLVDSVKEWRSEWFYAGNMNPPLAVHSNFGLVVNDRWEKAPLTSKELKKIKPLLEKIQTMKLQGLTGFRIVASFLRHWVQPLKARENYGFKYSGAVDPSWTVSILELTKEEMSERLKKVLKGVTIVPHTVLEYCADRPPPSVSCFVLCEYFLSFFLLLTLLIFGCL